MKISKSTKSLFWQNFLAVMQMILGVNLLGISLILLVFQKFLIGFLLMGAGIYFGIRGKMRRLDYKRKTGYIIYGE